MSLPVLESLKFELTVPSTQKKVQYRAFLVKEEKILLQAQESKDEKAFLQALIDVISACTFGEVDANYLTQCDLEYIFLQLRAKSVGETATVTIKCAECDHDIKINVKLDDVQVTSASTAADKIMLSATVGITLRPVQIRHMSGISADDMIGAIAPIIETIFDEENVHATDEADPKELRAFIENMSHTHIEYIKEFIESQPKLQHKVTVKCPECGHENEVVLEGLQTFFT